MSRIEVQVWVAGDHVVVRGGALEGELRLAFTQRDAADMSAALAEALHLCVPAGLPRGGTLNVLVGGSWLRWTTWPWQGTPPTDSQDWQVLAAPQALRMPGVAARIPASLVESLRPCVGRGRLECRAAPELAIAMAGRPEGAKSVSRVIAVVEPDCLTFLRLKGGFIVDAYAQPGAISASSAASSLREAWHRLALREVSFSEGADRTIVSFAGLPSAGAEIEGARSVVADERSLGKLPAGFLSWPLRRSSWRGWKGAVFAASLLLVMGSLTHLQRVLGVRSVEAMPAVVAPAVMTSARSPAELKERAIRIARINDVVRLLNAPFGSLLSAVRPTSSSGITLLALQLRTGKERVLVVEGTAASMQAMADYVKALAAKPVFSSVWLSRHVTASPEEGEGFHFQIEAGWRE